MSWLSSKKENGRTLLSSCSRDHIHILFSHSPDISLSELLRHAKAYSSKWIKSKPGIDPQFTWQEGYVAFSTQESKLDKVFNYIRSDKTRHQTKSYSEELSSILKQQDIKYDERYFLQKSFSRVLIHAVWSTHNRIRCLDKSDRHLLYDQIGKTISTGGSIMHEIGGVEDHVHMLIEMARNTSLSDLMKDVKTSATHWLKQSGESKHRDFSWQTGFGGFSVSLSNLEVVKNYIQQQEEHHKVISFQEEWQGLLKRKGWG